MKIVPLNEKSLKEAEKLLEKVFHPSKEEKLTLISSIYPKKYEEYLKKHNFKELKYYVLVENKKFIGMIGLYAYDKESYWLGWFCVDEKYRSKGFGKKLLDFAIYKAIPPQKSRQISKLINSIEIKRYRFKNCVRYIKIK